MPFFDKIKGFFVKNKPSEMETIREKVVMPVQPIEEAAEEQIDTHFSEQTSEKEIRKRVMEDELKDLNRYVELVDVLLMNKQKEGKDITLQKLNLLKIKSELELLSLDERSRTKEKLRSIADELAEMKDKLLMAS